MLQRLLSMMNRVVRMLRRAPPHTLRASALPHARFTLSSASAKSPAAKANELAARLRGHFGGAADPVRPMSSREAAQAFKNRLTGGRNAPAPTRPMTAREAAQALQERLRKKLRSW